MCGIYFFIDLYSMSPPQYVKVMAQNAQCTEDGPFFPPTARYLIQNGMSLDRNILQSPDWIVMVVLMAALILLCVVIMIALVSGSRLHWFILTVNQY